MQSIIKYILGFFLVGNCLSTAMQLLPPKDVKMVYKGYEPLNFPRGFLKGYALSCYQNSGSLYGNNNWDHWQQTTVRCNAQQQNLYKKSPIAQGQVINSKSSIYNNPTAYIKMLKALDCNALRFSLEWAEIQPQENDYNETMLTWYKDFVRHCAIMV